MSKDIKRSSAIQSALQKGINELADSVKVTLGPRGRNVVIGQKGGTPYITNDGVTIAREIELKDPFEKMGADLIKQAAEKTQEQAGDGTTTATLLTQAIINYGLEEISNGANPMYLKRGLEKGLKLILDELDSQSNDIPDQKTLKQIASISANNDLDIGKFIVDAVELVGQNGLVTVEDGNSVHTTIDKVDGMELNRGYISPHFITNPDRMNVELENPYIILLRERVYKLQDMVPILQEVQTTDRPLLIIADELEGEALSGLVVNAMKNTIKVAAIKSPEFGDYRRDIMHDIAALTDARIIDASYPIKKAKLADCAGSAQKVIINNHTTLIQEGGGVGDVLLGRINYLEDAIKEAPSDFVKDQLKSRLAKLSTGVAVIKVGAHTELELKEKKMRIDDALNATKAAMAEGYVIGGGGALFNCIPKVSEPQDDYSKEDKIAQKILVKSLSKPVFQISKNAGANPKKTVMSMMEYLKVKDSNIGFNADNESFEDLKEAGILDPTRVVKSGIKNAISIASLILTTECGISPELPEPREPFEFTDVY